MYVVTTPKHTFTFPVNPVEFKRILITYTQNDEIILEKTEHDLTFEELTENGKPVHVAWLQLSQEETKLFDPELKKFTVQVRALSKYDEAIAGDPHVFSVKAVLNDEVLQ